MGDFSHKLFVRFGEPSLHDFFLKDEYGKTLGAVPHQQEMRPTHALEALGTSMSVPLLDMCGSGKSQKLLAHAVCSGEVCPSG